MQRVLRGNSRVFRLDERLNSLSQTMLNGKERLPAGEVVDIVVSMPMLCNDALQPAHKILVAGKEVWVLDAEAHPIILEAC